MKRFFSIERIRNIGIIAHIDAGKTTTTERMLYYAGYTKHLGEVDSGSTVTDYLPQERERGITIVSACIPFGWKNHKINLVDSPGHVDFTMEVERSVRVLDGGVVILDAVNGVEAQTETVWKQANRNNLARLVFLNKMDREGSSVEKSLNSLKTKLTSWGRPLILQWPLNLDSNTNFYGKGAGGPGFKGIIDLISQTVHTFDSNSLGSTIKTTTLATLTSELKSEQLEKVLNDAMEHRKEIFQVLSDFDDEFLDLVIENNEQYNYLKVEQVKNAIRRCTIAGKIVPVLVGSSYKNTGVQLLLDSIIDYLPSPLDRPQINAISKNGKPMQLSVKDTSLSALAFKIVNDLKRGPIVYVRVYSGTLTKGQLLNTTRNYTEKCTKILQMYAGDFEQVDCANAGDIVALVGLKETKTGDTLVSKKPIDPRGFFTLESILVPAPVFQCSIVPESKADQEKLEKLESLIKREDPSLQIELNKETGQQIMSGMGELHLQIALDRLKREHKINLIQESVSVAYKESILLSKPKKYQYVYDRDILGTRAFAKLEMEISQCKPIETSDENGYSRYLSVPNFESGGGNRIIVSNDEFSEALVQGALAALSSGPITGAPVTNLEISIKLETLPDCSPTSVQSAIFHAINAFLNENSTILLEPIMTCLLKVPEASIGQVTLEFSNRKGNIVSVFNDQTKCEIRATAPLKELLGISSFLSSTTKGAAELSLELNGYAPVKRN